MARTTLTKTTSPGAYAGASVAVTFTAADAVNLNDFVLSGKELVIARNVGVSTRNVTLTSADDPFGRQENIVETIAAGAVRAFGPFALTGWIQTDGRFHLQADSADVEFAVIVLP